MQQDHVYTTLQTDYLIWFLISGRDRHRMHPKCLCLHITIDSSLGAPVYMLIVGYLSFRKMPWIITIKMNSMQIYEKSSRCSSCLFSAIKTQTVSIVNNNCEMFSVDSFFHTCSKCHTWLSIPPSSFVSALLGTLDLEKEQQNGGFVSPWIFFLPIICCFPSTLWN